MKKSGSHSELSKIYNEMRSHDIEPTIITFQILLSSTVKKGDIESMERYYGAMMELEIKPDERIFDLILDVYQRGGDFDKCWKIYQTMKQDKMKLNSFTFKKLFDACGFHNQTNYIDSIRADMVTSKISADLYHFVAIIKAFTKCDKIEEVFRMFSELKKIGMLETVQPLRAFMYTLKKTKSYRLIIGPAHYVFKDLQHQLDQKQPSDKLTPLEKVTFDELLFEIKANQEVANTTKG